MFVVDAKSGVTNKDYYFAEWLRKQEKKVVLVANKCENFNSDAGWSREYYKLGFGAPVGVSAEHKLGFGDLYEKIAPHYEEYQKNFAEVELSTIIDNEKNYYGSWDNSGVDKNHAKDVIQGSYAPSCRITG